MDTDLDDAFERLEAKDFPRLVGPIVAEFLDERNPNSPVVIHGKEGGGRIIMSLQDYLELTR